MVNNAVRALIVVCLVFTMGFKGKSSTTPDPDITAAIKQRLAMDGRIDPTGIDGKVENGKVTLTGTVETLEEKLLVDNLIASTQGAKALNNAIQVTPTATKDETIQRAVKETFKTVPAVQNKDIQVAVSQGIVTLKGAVEKRSHSLAAANAAKTVPGVIEVVNLIKVGTPRPDRDIERDVVFYLQSSSILNLDDVDYSVADGMVTLKGTIHNLHHKYAIANDLEKIHGVRGVDIRGLTVKTS